MEAILKEPKAHGADIVFYGYRSVWAPARNSATLFREFMTTAAELKFEWADKIAQSGTSIDQRDYRDVLIVAHSLGAVVARRALLDAMIEGAEWPSRSRLLLFGPAHMGTRLVALKGTLRSRPGSLMADLATLFQAKAPVLDDLVEGCEFLKSLLTESSQLVEAGVRRPIRAETVIFGEWDNVVSTTPFCVDPLSKVWPKEDHCGVCRLPETLRTVAELL
jgi:hypothetical protein